MRVLVEEINGFHTAQAIGNSIKTVFHMCNDKTVSVGLPEINSIDLKAEDASLFPGQSFQMRAGFPRDVGGIGRFRQTDGIVQPLDGVRLFAV
jgi:hypothetical protein